MVKWYLLWVAMLVVGGLAIFGLSQHQQQTAVSAVAAPEFNAERAWQDLVAQVDAGYRIPGTPTHARVCDWLVDQLALSAVTVQTQPFTRKLGGKQVTMWNIIATYDGNGKGPREQVLLCAHWDSRPTADRDRKPANRKLPIPGANDGASGVAVLLEVGRQLKQYPIARDVIIVLFDGEDYGPTIENMLLGAQHYAASLGKTKPAWGILLDMVGKKDLRITREPNSDAYARVVNDRVFLAARELGYAGRESGPRFVNTPYTRSGIECPIDDDHMPLNRAGVPTVDLIDFDYPAWHTRDDTPAQCSSESLAMVGKVVLQALRMP